MAPIYLGFLLIYNNMPWITDQLITGRSTYDAAFYFLHIHIHVHILLTFIFATFSGPRLGHACDLLGLAGLGGP